MTDANDAKPLPCGNCGKPLVCLEHLRKHEVVLAYRWSERIGAYQIAGENYHPIRDKHGEPPRSFTAWCRQCLSFSTKVELRLSRNVYVPTDECRMEQIL